MILTLDNEKEPPGENGMKAPGSHVHTGTMLLLAMLGAAVLPVAAQAQTTLIGAGVRNGNFDDDVSTTDQRTFLETPSWTNMAGVQTTTATRTNLVYNGSRNHQVSESPTVVAAQDTGHTIAAGEYFRVDYSWLDAWNWEDGSCQIAIKLFTTDTDAIDGAATTFATLLSGLSTANNAYQSAVGSAIATASEVGKCLFIAIDTVGDNDDGFARLDNFELTVASSPDGQVIFYDSFENPDISNDADGYSNTKPVGWTGFGGINHEKCGTIATPYGAQAAWLTSGAGQTGSAILTNVLQEGYTYKLTLNVARRSNLAARGNDYVVSLLASATTLASTNGAAGQSDFSETVEIVFTPDASHSALIGETLAIQLGIDTDYQPHFDNVMLVAVPPPVGGTLFLFE